MCFGLNSVFDSATTGFGGWLRRGSTFRGLGFPRKKKTKISLTRPTETILHSCIAAMSDEEEDYMSMVIEEPTQKETFTQRKRREQREVSV